MKRTIISRKLRNCRGNADGPKDSSRRCVWSRYVRSADALRYIRSLHRGEERAHLLQAFAKGALRTPLAELDAAEVRCHQFLFAAQIALLDHLAGAVRLNRHLVEPKHIEARPDYIPMIFIAGHTKSTLPASIETSF